MGKTRSRFVCQQCGHSEAKWLGRCPGCSTWNSLVEETQAPTVSQSKKVKTGLRGGKHYERAVPLSSISIEDKARTTTGMGEFDRALGGGLVPGALMLVGGDPGIGKSTLLLQTAAQLSSAGQKVLYLTAEESLSQVKLRAERLSADSKNVFLLAETRLEAVDQAIADVNPDLLIIDSVQTVGLASLDSAVGSVSQIRAVTHHLMELSKGQGITTFVVGHVTKEGAIAGPKVMEHMVDTVLYFEGDRHGPYRMLRAHKNRFGSAQEIGVFEMQSTGLVPISNPSELFLSERATGPGSAVVTSIEGSRPILLEVQALTNASAYGNPRRTTVGIDSQRVAMMCAVLERHSSRSMSGLDVYVNVAGGVKIQEPAADLGVALALASAARGLAIPKGFMVAGEVGLSGEVRRVTQLENRLGEAASLGFEFALVPKLRGKVRRPETMELIEVQSLSDALDRLGLS